VIAPGSGNVSSFGVDADGELLLLNYDAGMVLRIVPDTSAVPGRPEAVRAMRREQDVVVAWSAPSSGVRPVAYSVETTIAGGLKPVRSLDASDRREAILTLSEDEACVRVRAVSGAGAGPPSALVCPSP
jgi:hypothetical protein